MIHHYPSKQYGCELLMHGVSMNFSYAPYDIKVSPRTTFHTPFESYENNWVAMVTLRTPRTSPAKEISLLNSSDFLRQRTSSKGSTKYLKRVGTRERATL